MTKTKDINLTTMALLAKLKDQGVDIIVVSYAGSGDSGCIEHTGYFKYENLTRNDDGSLNPDLIGPWEHEDDILLNDESVNSLIEDLCTSYLMNGFSDWYNNEGGQGVILIETSTGKWLAQNGVNVITAEEESHEGKLSDL